jgi:hypothetical protein
VTVNACRMARVAGVGTDRPPLLGERGRRGSCCRLDGSGSCSTFAGTRTGLGRALSSAALSLPLRPRRPRLAATRTGQNRGAPKPTCARCPRALARLPWAWSMAPASPASAGTMAKSSGTGSTSAAARRRASARVSLPLLRSARDQASGTTNVATGERRCCCPPATRKAPRVRTIGERRAEGFQNASIRHSQQAPTRSLPCRIPLDCRDSANGANRDRTGDLLLAKQALSQLSYGPRSVQI